MSSGSSSALSIPRLRWQYTLGLAAIGLVLLIGAAVIYSVRVGQDDLSRSIALVHGQQTLLQRAVKAALGALVSAPVQGGAKRRGGKRGGA